MNLNGVKMNRMVWPVTRSLSFCCDRDVYRLADFVQLNLGCVSDRVSDLAPDAVDGFLHGLLDRLIEISVDVMRQACLLGRAAVVVPSLDRLAFVVHFLFEPTVSLRNQVFRERHRLAL